MGQKFSKSSKKDSNSLQTVTNLISFLVMSQNITYVPTTPPRTIFDVIASGDLNELANLLQSNPNAANYINAEGMSPLYYVIAKKIKFADKIVEMLIAAGANVNYAGNRLPLFAYAPELKSISIIEKLVAAGADVNAANGTSMNNAISNGCLDIVRFLLEHNADPNIDNGTPLMNAIAYNYPYIVQLLLEHGADPRIRNKDGRTPEEKMYLNPVMLNVLKEHRGIAVSNYPKNYQALAQTLKRITEDKKMDEEKKQEEYQKIVDVTLQGCTQELNIIKNVINKSSNSNLTHLTDSLFESSNFISEIEKILSSKEIKNNNEEVEYQKAIDIVLNNCLRELQFIHNNLDKADNLNILRNILLELSTLSMVLEESELANVCMKTAAKFSNEVAKRIIDKFNDGSTQSKPPSSPAKQGFFASSKDEHTEAPAEQAMERPSV